MYESLQKLGLKRKESLVYLATLDLGTASPASIIAKKAHVNRTTAYDILEQLIEKGVIVSFEKQKTKYYEALPPAKLVAYLKYQSEKFAQLSNKANALLP
mgnify:FL=1